MFGMVRHKRNIVRDRTVYMEICGYNKVTYRVVVGRISINGEDIVTYGVEAQDRRTGEYAAIPDFSRDIEDAVDFAEMLITGRTSPAQIYGKALSYLCTAIS